MFKFRKSGANRRDTDSVETIRRRAQYRLVGTAILVGVAIVGFPLVFDTEPRPLQVDLPVAIPSKDAVQPLVLPSAAVQAQAQQAAKAQEAEQRAEQQAAASQAGAAAAKAQQASQQEAQLQAQAQAQAQVQAQAQAKADQDKQAAGAAASAAAQQAQSKQAEAARARAILEGNVAKAAGAAPAANTAANTATKTDYPDDGKRRVIQVGSFNDVVRAREVRLRLERAGITTYTQVVTSNGARFIRVRVGPFDDAKELQRYIDRVEALNLEARVLTF
jgi:DedD protein